MIKLIAIIDNNYVIGSTNSADEEKWESDQAMDKFNSIIMNKKILMGSTTFPFYTEDQLTDYQEVFVLTRNPEKFAKPKSLEVNLKFITDSKEIKETYKNKPKDDIFIIGGAKVWKEFIDVANEIYLIRTKSEFKAGNLFFPYKKLSHFKLTKKEKASSYILETYIKK